MNITLLIIFICLTILSAVISVVLGFYPSLIMQFVDGIAK